jgi:hypothetical protein
MNFEKILIPTKEVNNLIKFLTKNQNNSELNNELNNKIDNNINKKQDNKLTSLNILLELLKITNNINSEETIKFIDYLNNCFNINLFKYYYDN